MEKLSLETQIELIGVLMDYGMNEEDATGVASFIQTKGMLTDLLNALKGKEGASERELMNTCGRVIENHLDEIEED